MHRTRALIALAVVLAVPAAVAGIAAAHGGHGDSLSDARRATARFHDLDRALAAGYTLRLPELSGETCIVQPGEGAMGVHQVNTALLDATLDPRRPEVLVYEPERHGKLRLVAVEYVIFEADWTGSGAPRLFGRPFDYVPSPNRYGLPAFYALHAWIWKRNPSGLFYAWNPRVSC